MSDECSERALRSARRAPLVLALPVAFDLSPLVVATQTLVEFVAMVAFVRLIPRVVPAPPAPDTDQVAVAHTSEITT